MKTPFYLKPAYQEPNPIIEGAYDIWLNIDCYSYHTIFLQWIELFM